MFFLGTLREACQAAFGPTLIQEVRRKQCFQSHYKLLFISYFSVVLFSFIYIIMENYLKGNFARQCSIRHRLLVT